MNGDKHHFSDIYFRCLVLGVQLINASNTILIILQLSATNPQMIHGSTLRSICVVICFMFVYNRNINIYDDIYSIMCMHAAPSEMDLTGLNVCSKRHYTQNWMIYNVMP